MKNEKHEFLYNYARAAFDDELQRFRNIEDKAAKYLSLLSVGIVAYTFLLRFYTASIFPAETFLQWCACIAVFVTYLAMISSWSFLYRALSFIEMPRLPLDDEFIGRYEPETLPTIHFALTRSCADALKYARKGNLEKSELLIKGYKDIAFSMWAISVSVMLLILSNLIISEGAEMTEKKESQPTQQQTSSEPNKDVPPPKITFVLDHAIPEIKKGQQQINESGGNKSKE